MNTALYYSVIREVNSQSHDHALDRDYLPHPLPNLVIILSSPVLIWSLLAIIVKAVWEVATSYLFSEAELWKSISWQCVNSQTMLL